MPKLFCRGIPLDVTVVKPTTQQGQRLLRAYELTGKGDSIYKAYGKPSNKKIHAFFEIKKEMEDVGGWAMRITDAGSDYFSCAYRVRTDSDIEFLIYHTHLNRYAVQMEV